MRTVVYQSYRTTNVAPWIARCMATVQAWAQANGFDYRFIDDRLFAYAPDWFREKAQHHVCPVSDLARLLVAKELLAQGYARTVWVDADMLVFAPQHLRLDAIREFAFCKEIWFYRDADGQAQYREGVNNAITIFTQHNRHLDFFIDACLRIADTRPQLGKLDVGTLFLSQLGQILPFQVLTNVGLFSPDLMADMLRGADDSLRSYAARLNAPLACANLCTSLQGSSVNGIVCDDALFDAVVDRCLQTQGDVINQWVQA